MIVYNSIEEFAKTGYESHVALGFFDGVHLGHRAVIGGCIDGRGDRTSVVLTFAENPAKLLGKADVRLITDNARKAELIAELGADALIFADFMRLKDMEAEDFIRRVLHEQLRAKRVVCGYNYRFGRFGRGDVSMLKKECAALGIEVSVCEPVYCGDRAVSSTAVRELLQAGDMALAGRMLGYPYAVSGRVGTGNRVGSQMGYPTVNLPIGEGLIAPRFGVYAARMIIGGKTYRGATNIGVHPTVKESREPLCETFLLDYHGDGLYGESIVCEPAAFIRQEMKFASIDELTAQIGRDIEEIKRILQY